MLLSLAYSLRLKRIPFTDVITIGVLFSLRIVAGMIVLNQPISLWLAGFTLPIFLLGLGKAPYGSHACSTGTRIAAELTWISQRRLAADY